MSSGGSTYEVTDDSLNVDEEEPHDEAADPELAQLLEQADTAMAAPPPVIPPAELKLRNTAKFLLNTAKTIAGKDATQSQIRILSTQLTKFRNTLTELDRLTERRLQTDTEDTNLREREIEEWLNEQMALEEEYQTYATKVSDWETADADTVAPPPELAAKKSAMTMKINSIKKAIAEVKTAVTKEKAENQNMARAKFDAFNGTLQTIRKRINSDIETLVEQINSLDPDSSDNMITEATKHQDDLNALLQVVQQDLLAAPILDQSLFIPPLASSRQGSSNHLAQQMSQDSLNLSRRHKYKLEDVPDYDGKDPCMYPAFKQEWLEGVQVGQEDSWIIRHLNKKTPKADDLTIFTTAAEAWDYLDQKYANPLVVSSTLIDQFLNTKVIPGPNEETKLANLRHMVMKLIVNLRVVKQEFQMTRNLSVLNHCVKLMPERYCRDFSKCRQMHEQQLGNALAPEDVAKNLWECLDKFLKEERLRITTYTPWLILDSKETKEVKKPAAKVNAVKTNASKPPAASASSSSSGGLPDKVKKMQAEYGNCPQCQKPHTWKSANGIRASDRLADCPTFRGLSVDERVAAVKRHKACVKCLSWRHVKDACQYANMKCVFQVNNADCAGPHHRMLHGATDRVAINLHQVNAAKTGSPEVLLPLVKVDVNGQFSTVCMLDGGSSTSIITWDLAKRLKLHGKEARVWVELAGEPAKLVDCVWYNLNWTLSDGSLHHLKLLGLEKITSNPGKVNVDYAYSLFPEVPAKALERPVGDVELLIGQDYVQFQPFGGGHQFFKEGLRAMETILGTGWVLTGRNPHILQSAMQFTKQVNMWRDAVYHQTPVLSINRIQVAHHAEEVHEAIAEANPPTEAACVHCCAHIQTQEFFETEIMGVATPRKCKKCRACIICNVTGEGRSLQDQVELDLMREAITLDPEAKRLRLTYPPIADLSVLKDNRVQAEQRAAGLTKQLTRKGFKQQYDQHFMDYINRGVLGETTHEEIERYKASGKPIHYVAHHAVFNSHSQSTPVRLVLDTSIKNMYTGPSLNQLIAKGPSSLNLIFNVLIKWRSYEYALIYDVSKMYHQFMTGEAEFFLRLVTWKLEGDDEWRVWGHNTIAMGDLPAVTYVELGMMLIADAGRHIDAVAAQQIVDDRYVDDGAGGGDKEQVMRMRGSYTIDEQGNFTSDGTLSQLLGLASMKPKMIVISGDDDPQLIAKVGKVLGVSWHPTQDTISYHFVFTLHQKRGAQKTGPDLSASDVEMIMTLTFTRRVALTLTAQMFDPIGHTCGFSCKFKIALKHITAERYEWDQPLSEQHQSTWRELVRSVLLSEPVHFPRSLRTHDVIARPELIGYWDGSSEAFAAVVYIRWWTETFNTWHSTLVTAKCRVTPAAGFTTPRSELSGLVMLTRLLNSIVNNLDVPAARITLAGDSTCVISSMEVNAALLTPFFANRCIEALSNMQSWGNSSNLQATEELPPVHDINAPCLVDQLWHTPGELNPSDAPSRGTLSWEDLGPGTLWQDGPQYLRQSRESWPLARNFVPDVPQEETRRRFININAVNVTSPITVKIKAVMDYSDSFKKVTGILARLVAAARAGNDRTKISQSPSGLDYREAVKWMKWLSMMDLQQWAMKHDLSSLNPQWLGGLAYTTGRLGTTSMMKHLGHRQLLILPPNSRLAILYLIKAHNEDHKGIGDCLYRSRRQGIWIINGRKLAKEVVKKCVHCQLMRKQALKQQMGPLPEEKTNVPCPAFTHVQIDYLAPIMCIDSVKRRIAKKAFPVAFTCLNTMSLHLLAAEDYSFEGFMTIWTMFCHDKGHPQFVYTDMGSQLCKGASSLAMYPEQGRKLKGTQSDKRADHNAVLPELAPPPFPWEKIRAATAEEGVVWKIAPSGAHHRLGLVERMNALTKTSLRNIGRHGTMTILELTALLGKVAWTINNRPLGTFHASSNGEQGLVPITPNLLLTGARIPVDKAVADSDNDPQSYYGERHEFMVKTFGDWWKEWFHSVFDTLVPFRKWKTSHRNVREGDIVMIMFDKKVGNKEYRYGRVLEAKMDADGKVRSCNVGVLPRDKRNKPLPYVSKDLLTMYVPVQRLVMITPVELLTQRPTVIGDSSSQQHLQAAWSTET